MTRYNNAQSVLYRGSETRARLLSYSWMTVRPADTDISTFKVTTQNAGAPRRIAQAIYGDHELYWVLPMFNSKWYADSRAMQVLNWPVAGQVLYYPQRHIIMPTIA